MPAGQAISLSRRKTVPTGGLDCAAAFQKIARDCVAGIKAHHSSAYAADIEAVHRIRLAITRCARQPCLCANRGRRGMASGESPGSTSCSAPRPARCGEEAQRMLGEMRDLKRSADKRCPPGYCRQRDKFRGAAARAWHELKQAGAR